MDVSASERYTPHARSSSPARLSLSLSTAAERLYHRPVGSEGEHWRESESCCPDLPYPACSEVIAAAGCCMTNLEPLKGRVPNADRLAISTRNLGEAVVDSNSTARPFGALGAYRTYRLHAARDTPNFHRRKKPAIRFFWRGNRHD
jgi:hypothetical protein